MNYANLKKLSLKNLWKNWGFRTRLIIALSSSLAVVLTIGYWALFLEFQEELQSEFDRSLYNYATDLLGNVQITSGGEADLPFHVIFSEDKVFPFPHGDALVKIYRYPFQELFSFSSDKEAPIDLLVVQEHIRLNQDNQFYDLQSPSGSLWRGVLMRVEDAPVSTVYFFVAVPRESLTSQENKFRSLFIAGQLILLMMTAALISLLAKKMLKSFETLTQSIHRMPLNQKEFEFAIPEGPPEITLLVELLNKLLSQVRQSLRAHQEFVAQAAHQLKTPLTIAKGHLEQYTQLHPLGQEENPLKVVLEEIDLMSGTISNLLNLVQIESGFQNLKSSPIDLLDQVISSVDRLDYLARKKSLKFQIQCEDISSVFLDSDWVVNTDPQLLSIILNNLFENAIKYASQSPIEVKLSTSTSYSIITIRNPTNINFEGLTTSDLKAKFVRGQNPEAGQGLGLYIVSKIATALHMQFDVEFGGGFFQVSLKIPT